MSERLSRAQAELTAGRRAEAIALIAAELAEAPDQPAPVFRVLAGQLFQAGRHAEAAAWAEQGLARYPADFELWNVRGVALRQLGRLDDALMALERALALRPGDVAVRFSLGNLRMGRGDFAGAAELYAALAGEQAENAELHRLLGRARLRQGEREAAVDALRRAVTLNPQAVDAWLDLLGVLADGGAETFADTLFEAALNANPGDQRLLRQRGALLRRMRQGERARTFLRQVLAAHPDAGWAHLQLALELTDDAEALAHLRRAVELDPADTDPRMALALRLQHALGAEEGRRLDEAHALILGALEAPLTPAQASVAAQGLLRVCDLDALDRLGDPRTLGRRFAEAGLPASLLRLMPRARTHEDRLELLEQHSIWGRAAEAAAAKRPIERRSRTPGGKLRLGLVSASLRGHVAAYFALPIFEHLDRERFEVFCYATHRGPEHSLQARLAALATAYRWTPDAGARDLAQAIADDGLDMLIEIGGPTDGARLEALAYRPALRQASWLGYPHSTGLSVVDYMVCDPFSRPASPDLLLETPLVLPHSMISLGEAAFPQDRPAETIAEDRNGFITFGTANDPYKFNRETFRAWAAVVAATPDSRFAFVRPEAGSQAFRRNVLAEFAAAGIAEDRVVFHAVRGGHMPYYDEIDITLDPFPVTGGTTTAEALWMGAPVVTRVGEGLAERLSYSILSNAGLGDLCAADANSYHAAAVSLAGDAERRRDLKRTLRDRIRESPLGQTEAFARDFYDLIARTAQAG